ncbi:MAG: cytochrome c3 family protein [Anaerolineales bacterium]|nr:cytochrome c3 family protein [Anaerolineales bacterium]
MMKRHIILRLIVGLLFALPLSTATGAFAMSSRPSAPEESDAPACSVCHEQTHAVWQQGAHGRALEDQAFQEAWEAKGEPAACLRCHASSYDPVTGEIAEPGVSCAACHGEYVQGHPAEPMPTYASATTCDQCHVETHFEWQASRHASVDMACTACHSPHAADIRTDDPSELCGSCHQPNATGFAHDVHSEVGLNCADCHLEAPPDSSGEAHVTRDHSFNVSLSSCTDCHDFHTHRELGFNPDDGVQTSGVSSASSPTQSEPDPVSPVGYATLVGILGFAGGMVLTPWLERLYRKLREE